jgi:coproporphyrinogen III oxidase
VFEKAGVAFSDVNGTLRPEMARSLPGTGDTFRATGVSLIFHPRARAFPTVHANVRHIQRGDRGWFGGGTI